MSSRPLLVFDFDGVIVDGMDEYWWSARQACLHLIGASGEDNPWPETVPDAFLRLRPWVHHGWEMVLLAAELQRADSQLLRQGVDRVAASYSKFCQRSLDFWGWCPEQLQQALEEARRQALMTDRDEWLARHRPFPGVVERLRAMPLEGTDWAVLTTKGTEFTAELLNSFQLSPRRLYGHEAGSKPEVLLQLAAECPLRGFVEDRRATLERVLVTPGLQGLRCYLVSWGYIRPEDTQDLPSGICLLDQDALATPLAAWP